MVVEFEVAGRPQGKERPRFSHGHTYTPKRTADYEKMVRGCYRGRSEETFGERPLKAEITGVFQIPRSARRKDIPRMLSGEIKCKIRPDTDNIAKSILDSLNGIAYKDDSQIVELKVSKVYGTEDKVIVRLTDENC